MDGGGKSFIFQWGEPTNTTDFRDVDSKTLSHHGWCEPDVEELGDEGLFDFGTDGIKDGGGYDVFSHLDKIRHLRDQPSMNTMAMNPTKASAMILLIDQILSCFLKLIPRRHLHHNRHTHRVPE